MTTRTKPPFRADHVGSLLRPARLKEARARHEKNEIGADELRAIEDEEIVKIVRSRRRSGCSLRPTANSAARGGISTSSAS